MGAQKIVLLGSTGSIGRNVLRVAEGMPGLFEVVALAAGEDDETLAKEAERFGVTSVALRSHEAAERLRARTGADVRSGDEGILELVRTAGGDILVNAVVGAAGLAPTLAALGAYRRICIANKESLVAAGEIVMRRAAAEGTEILPVDSEHVAVHQCLRGEEHRRVRRLLLTASGGPFRKRSAEEMENVTVREALAHPTWTMGRKITIDSATLMNKGLEVIEAMHLFGMPAERVDVVVHPQSVIHSLVEFEDRSYVAQLGETDMRHPIRYALCWPDRPPAETDFDLTRLAPLTFEAADPARFPCFRLAREAAARGGTAPAVLNGANEVAVEAFLGGRIRFLEIAEVIEETLGRASIVDGPSEADVFAADGEARRLAREIGLSVGGRER